MSDTAKPESASSLVTITMTAEQLNTTIGALYEKLVETENYERSSRIPDEPRPEHTCCPTHLSYYERDRDLHRAMKDRRKHIKRTIKLLEKSAG